MESAKKSYAAEGPSNQPARREEAKNINTSLYALGTVIERLASGDVGHVPWRNSKLTRLLQDSLGGNSRSAIVTTLRAEEKNIDETIGTLRFAQRAKAIAVKVTQKVTRDAAGEAHPHSYGGAARGSSRRNSPSTKRSCRWRGWRCASSRSGDSHPTSPRAWSGCARKEQAAMLSREHQHNQNDLSQRISAAEERESNQGSPLPNRTPRPPAGGSGLRPRSAETADADAAAATAADAATHAAAAASAVTTPRLIELASPRLGDAIADEPSSQALRVRSLEAEVAYLKGCERRGSIARDLSILTPLPPPSTGSSASTPSSKR